MTDQKEASGKINANGGTKIPTVILCGGVGTRLREETEFKPKPMVKIGDKPLLWHIMKIYSHFGFNDFLVALGYKGEMIKDYFSKNNEDNFNITMVDTGQESLTGERIRRVKNHIQNDTFMVTYGDGVADVNIIKLLDFHKKQNTLVTITGVHPRHKYGLVSVDENNLVKEFFQKPTLPDLVNGGFMVLDKKVFDYIEKDSMIEDMFVPLAKAKQVSLYRHENFWYAVDTYKEYEEANKMWLENPKWRIWKS